MTAAASPTVTSLFEEFADGIYTLGYRLTGDRQLAEDVVQETFIKVMRSLSSYRGDGPIAAWLYRIGYREAIAVTRKRKDEPTEPDTMVYLADRSDDDVEREIVSRELAAVLDAAISSLTPPLRAAFVLRDVEGLSTAEVAAALDASESAVKMRLARAREALRVQLKEYL